MRGLLLFGICFKPIFAGLFVFARPREPVKRGGFAVKTSRLQQAQLCPLGVAAWKCSPEFSSTSSPLINVASCYPHSSHGCLPPPPLHPRPPLRLGPPVLLEVSFLRLSPVGPRLSSSAALHPLPAFVSDCGKIRIHPSHPSHPVSCTLI